MNCRYDRRMSVTDYLEFRHMLTMENELAAQTEAEVYQMDGDWDIRTEYSWDRPASEISSMSGVTGLLRNDE